MEEKIIKQIKDNDEIEFLYQENNYKYIIQIKKPQIQDKFNIPYLLIIPQNINDNSILAVETNNIESNVFEKVYSNAFSTAYNLINILKEFSVPVLVPIIPSIKNAPYYQHLAKECFYENTNSNFYRIDLQVRNIIEKVIEELNSRFKLNINKKIFLNGYSASGVFAQRFALIHPDIIQMLCIGGASGSIPVPSDILSYPLGINDLYKLVGKEFDFKNYCLIKQRYYVGSLENLRKSNNRYDENGDFAAMHDMSYFDRSVPYDIGNKQRSIFGKNLIDRSKKEIQFIKEMGIDIEQKIFVGRSHNNFIGAGVNELGSLFIKEKYMEMISYNKIK